jgi:hypothetical protein
MPGWGGSWGWGRSAPLKTRRIPLIPLKRPERVFVVLCGPRRAIEAPLRSRICRAVRVWGGVGGEYGDFHGFVRHAAI